VGKDILVEGSGWKRANPVRVETEISGRKFAFYSLHLPGYAHNKSRPTTPIVLAEDSHYDDLPTKKGDILRKISAKLIAQGDTNLYFLSNKGMLGEDGDGVADDRHPNDLGMARQAAVFMKFLEPILAKQKLKHESNGTGIH